MFVVDLSHIIDLILAVEKDVNWAPSPRIGCVDYSVNFTVMNGFVEGEKNGQRRPPLSVTIKYILEHYPDGQIFMTYLTLVAKRFNVIHHDNCRLGLGLSRFIWSPTISRPAGPNIAIMHGPQY